MKMFSSRSSRQTEILDFEKKENRQCTVAETHFPKAGTENGLGGGGTGAWWEANGLLYLKKSEEKNEKGTP